MGAKFAFAVATDRVVNTARNCPANGNFWPIRDSLQRKSAFGMMTQRNASQENPPGIHAKETLC
jgi:hypothetical protein